MSVVAATVHRMTTTTTSRALRSIRGTVVLPGDPSYADARLPWSRAVDQRPAAVVTPVDEADVQRLVHAARDAGLQIAAQPTGHGASSSLEGVVVVRMDAFDHVSVDAAARTARVGGGARIGALSAALEGTGLVGPTGTSATVGVAGFTLGGGFGWFGRLGGLGGQWLRRVRVVDGTGEARWIDDADQAMSVARGAGGLLGIVTELELELRPVSALVGGTLRFAAADSPAVLHAMLELEQAPAGLGLSAASVRMPDAPFLPEAVRGQSWLEVQTVLADVDASVLDPIRASAPVLDESLRSMQPADLASITNDPVDPGVSHGWAASVPSLDRAADAVCAFHTSDAAASVVAIEVRLTSGIPNERPAVAQLDAPWLMYGIAPVLGGDGTQQRAAIEAMAVALDDVTTARVVPTFLGDLGYERALSPTALTEAREQHERLGADVVAPVRLS